MRFERPVFRSVVTPAYAGVIVVLMPMFVRPRQLVLALDHAESYAREDFLSGPCNEDALRLDRELAGLAARTPSRSLGLKVPARRTWR